MEILVTALIIVNGILLGGTAVGLIAIKDCLRRWDQKICAQEVIADSYHDHLLKAAESNNALIAKLVELGDKVAAHEMIIKGSRR